MLRTPIAIVVTLGCTTLSWGASGYNALTQDFRSSFEIDIRRFTGAWYELARTPNPLEDGRKRKNGKIYSACYNVKTDVAMQTREKLHVRNSCSRKSRKGDVMQDMLGGHATVVNGTGDRKLKVAFGSVTARMLQRLLMGGGPNYLIYCVGPINKDGRYDWAVTGGAQRRFAFLLARDRAVSERTKAKMLACARREGIPVHRLMYLQR